MTALVIGIGHRFRGDDAVGPMVADRVAALGLCGVSVLDHHGEGTDLMERWSGFERVFLVDATCSGTAPGTVRVWDAAADDLPAGLFPKGSHVFGVAEGVAMARLLGRLPPEMTVIGIEGRAFAAGDDLTADTKPGMDEAVALIAKRLG